MKRRGFLKALAGGVAAACVSANMLLARSEPAPELTKPEPIPEDTLDLRGRPLTEEDLRAGIEAIRNAPNYGTPTHIYMPPSVARDLGIDVDALGRWEV